MACSLESRRLARSAWNLQWRSAGSRMVVLTVSSGRMAYVGHLIPKISQKYLRLITALRQLGQPSGLSRAPNRHSVLESEQDRRRITLAFCSFISFLTALQEFCSEIRTPHPGVVLCLTVRTAVPSPGRARGVWPNPTGRSGNLAGPATEFVAEKQAKARHFVCLFAVFPFCRLLNQAVYGKEVMHGSC